MKMITLAAALLGISVPLWHGTQAQAQQFGITWVSAVSGNDGSASCSPSAPCRTFGGAFSKTATGGVITCLDVGGFDASTLTINRSITIDCVKGFALPSSNSPL